jgi:hypothetical protein
MGGCFSNITTMTKRNKRISFESKPFAKGQVRLCFKGHTITENESE